MAKLRLADLERKEREKLEWQRIIWKCWQTRKPYDEAIYEAALRKSGSPLAALLDQIELGKSRVKKN